jgi:hypothetical protein
MVYLYGHSPEADHKCPKCGAESICLIEDGFCDNDGLCDSCIREAEMNRIDREDN